MLHIVNKSPGERSTLASCLAHARPGHSVLLIEDAVYAAEHIRYSESYKHHLPIFRYPVNYLIRIINFRPIRYCSAMW